jgi:hypothetical protein
MEFIGVLREYDASDGNPPAAVISERARLPCAAARPRCPMMAMMPGILDRLSGHDAWHTRGMACGSARPKSDREPVGHPENARRGGVALEKGWAD